MRRGLRIHLGAAIGASLLLAGGAAGAAAPVEAVLACARVAEAAERLACYDRTVPALRQASPAAADTSSPAAIAAPPPVAPSPEQRFGAERVRSPAAAPTPDDTPDTLSAKLVSTRTAGNGRLVLTLDNGQVWALKETGAPSPRPGTGVIIETAIFGSYNLRFEGQNRFFKAARVQ